jgi:hypothetical protein
MLNKFESNKWLIINWVPIIFCLFYCLVQILMEKWTFMELILIRVYHVSTYELFDSYWIMNSFLIETWIWNW